MARIVMALLTLGCDGHISGGVFSRPSPVAAGPALPSAASAAPAGSGAAPAPVTRTTPDPRFLAPATGTCPEFTAGMVTFTPAGVQRSVLLYIGDSAKTQDGPLVFSWHTVVANPAAAIVWVGKPQIDQIVAQGGIVVAPTGVMTDAVRPWDNTPNGPLGTDNDERLMDEVVACAQAKVGIELRRIYSIGATAGGLKTASVSLMRSGYLAAAVVYSGGLAPNEMPLDQDPNNKLPVMIVYGGQSDVSPVDNLSSTATTEQYRDVLEARGSLAILCDHGKGHTVPEDSQAAALRFLTDHPFGTQPSPYAANLPADFPRYCQLN